MTSWATFGFGVDNQTGAKIVKRRAIFGFAVDLDNNKIWVRLSSDPNQWWNNSNTANPATNTGGYDIASINDGVSVMPAFSGFFGTSVADIAIINAGHTSFWMSSLPSGFSAWDASGTTTWNPSDKDANITLSNGNLTATQSSAATAWKAVRAVGSSKHTGKWYFEITTDRSDPNFGWIAGVANSTASLTNFIGSDNNGNGYQTNSTSYKNGSATSSAISALALGAWRSAVLASTGHHTGKFYFECKVDLIDSANGWIIGVANGTFASTTADIDNYAGSDGTGLSVGIQSGSTFAGAAAYYIAAGSNGSGITGAVQGDVMGVAVDLTNNKIWFRVNGGGWTLSGTGDPVNNTGGISITSVNNGVAVMPVFSGFNDTGFAEQGTIRTTTSEFSFTAPTGFLAWDTVVLVDTLVQEALLTSTTTARLSTFMQEVLMTSTTTARVSTVLQEVLLSTFLTGGELGGGAVASSSVSVDPSMIGASTGGALAPNPATTMQITQLAAEVLEAQTSAIQVSQLAAEVLNVRSPSLQVSGVFMEVLRSSNPNVLPRDPRPRTRVIR